MEEVYFVQEVAAVEVLAPSSPEGSKGLLRFIGPDGTDTNLAIPRDLLPAVAVAALTAHPAALPTKTSEVLHGPEGQLVLYFELEKGGVGFEIDLGQAEVLVEYLAQVLGRAAPPSPGVRPN